MGGMVYRVKSTSGLLQVPERFFLPRVALRIPGLGALRGLHASRRDQESSYCHHEKQQTAFCQFLGPLQLMSGRGGSSIGTEQMAVDGGNGA